MSAEEQKNKIEECIIGNRRVWFETGWENSSIYKREKFPGQAKFNGPAIIEQLDTTIIVEPNNQVEVDLNGNLIISL